ncbi:MAG: hypothetical protein ACK4RM_07100 [Flavobacterium sp.]
MKKRYWGVFFQGFFFLITSLLFTNLSNAQCLNTSEWGSATAPTTNSEVQISGCNWQNEYSPVYSIIAGNTYQISVSCGGYVTVRSGSYNGTVVSHGVAPHSFTASSSGTYFIHYNTNASCGTASTCCTTTIACTSCSAPSGCVNTSAWGSTSAPTNSTATTISTCNYQTEYSTISSVVAGTSYTISNSCGGFITVRSGTYNGALVAQGNAPLTWTASSSGTHFIHYNTNSSCGTATTCCTTNISCASCPAPTAPTNDLCINATSLPCGTTGLTGSTTNTTNQNHGSGCLMSNFGVWYTFMGDGSTTTVTSTANFDHEMSISYGSCGSLINVSCHDNTWGFGTETASFPTINGQTYYIYISDWLSGSTTTGNFTISRTCSTPCSPGDGTGTSTLACPSVLAGGLGLSGVDPDPVNCDEISGCVTLEAEYLQLGTTANYNVESIPYAPPYQFECLQNPVSVNDDDVWSPIINLPFNFCFYGNNYNQCIISSNGVISFDLVNNNPGGYSSWSFNNNLPSPSLFLNSIFGVYHDIDPQVGGTVGWELITLNSGCRALVASWNDIPMFSSTCNSMLYTGMIVLYEDTNVIEVYIQEKNVCATWNDGNAIVGIQNAAGTQAVVPPGRNGLSPNWNTTNEAWRFTPSGPSITTIQWFEGATASGPVIGTTDTISVCPTSTTTYTAQVTYTLCNGTILNEIDQTTVNVTVDKIWNGSVNNDWDVVNNWTPIGVPTIDNCVIIPVTPNNPEIDGSGYNGLAKNLSVLNGATLTVFGENALTVSDWTRVEPNGTFEINHNASLIQINDAINIGNIVYKRNSSLKRLDYVYWSSPVSNFILNQIPAPLTSGPMFYWHPTTINPNGFEGNWLNASGHQMISGKGYIMRAPGSFSTTTPQTLYGSFEGVPNNGHISIPVSRGNNQSTTVQYTSSGAEVTNYSDNQNLIGNPYPSAIRANQFLVDNQNVIEGVIKLWMHGISPDLINSPYYQDFVYNYTPDDYLIYNFLGTSCCPSMGPELFIGGGQGFFVEMKDGPAANDVVSFNNQLRHFSYDNSFFFRTSKPKNINASILNLKHRFWLDIINANMDSSRTMIGYTQEATYGKDSFYDAITSIGSHMSIFSLIDHQKFNIQGRPAPLNIQDEVPIGFHAPNEGTYKIALAANDALFDTQNIYLKDNLLETHHLLQAAPYEFFTNAGVDSNRFSIVYTNQTLGVHQIKNSDIQVISNQQISVFSKNQLITDVEVYDLLGRQLMSYKDVYQNELTLWEIMKNNTGLMLRVTMENGKKSIHKVIH